MPPATAPRKRYASASAAEAPGPRTGGPNADGGGPGGRPRSCARTAPRRCRRPGPRAATRQRPPDQLRVCPAQQLAGGRSLALDDSVGVDPLPDQMPAMRAVRAESDVAIAMGLPLLPSGAGDLASGCRPASGGSAGDAASTRVRRESVAAPARRSLHAQSTVSTEFHARENANTLPAWTTSCGSRETSPTRTASRLVARA